VTLSTAPARPVTAAPRTGLDRALQPRSVAILGASDDPLRISGRSLNYMKHAGFAGALYPINNRRDTVQGVRAYARVAGLPEAPDLAIIALGAPLVEEAVRQCADAGVGAAIIHAAGFAEVSEEGKAMQERVMRIARDGGLRLFGPNCLGLLNARLGMIGTFSSGFDAGLPTGGPLAIVSQSGAYAGHLAYLCRERGIGLNYWISTGNEADVDIAECIAWLARQDDVSVIMAYCEGVRHGPRFVEALRLARENGKAMVFAKVGSSDKGAAAAHSHTASLAGADGVYDALFRQYGVHRARTTEEHVDIAYAASKGVYPAGDRVGIVTVSGGFGIQLCDAAERFGLDVAPMPPAAQARLKAINPHGGVSNPCDTTSNFLNDMSLIDRTFETLFEEGDYDSIIGSFTVLPDSPTYGAKIREAIRAGTERFRDRPTLLCMAARPEVTRSYDEAGFLVFSDSDRAVVALAALGRFRDAKSMTADPVPTLPAPVDLGREPLSEAAAQAVLASAGLLFLPSQVVNDRGAAADAAAHYGARVAMKIVSPDILHKTDIGGVMLNVDGREAVAEAYDTLRARAATTAPDARIEGVLVTPMAPKGIETIVGMTRDPVFGPVVMFGLGGVFTELFEDVTFRLAPFSREEAHRMIAETKGYKLLAGYRGAAAADIDALAGALETLSCFAAANADALETVEINPLLVLPRGEGVVALDAVVVPRACD
jgi:acyl-CoA synthetase (NDP forming)